MHHAWEKIIDLVTLVWLGVFAASQCGIGTGWTGPASAAIAVVFVADLVVIYRRCHGFSDFIRHAWLDLLLLIPFFRVFRFFRIGRISRLARFRRITRLFRPGLFESAIEGLDLAQKSVERLKKLKIEDFRF